MQTIPLQMKREMVELLIKPQHNETSNENLRLYMKHQLPSEGCEKFEACSFVVDSSCSRLGFGHSRFKGFTLYLLHSAVYLLSECLVSQCKGLHGF